MKNNIIIGNLSGGLGNQMFQYAAYRSMSLNSSRSLLLAIDSFQNYSLYNGYELNSVFGINETILAQNVKNYLGFYSPMFIRKLIARAHNWVQPNWFVCDNNFTSKLKIFNSSDYIYAHGYWQSELFFKDHASLISNIFTFNPSIQFPHISTLRMIQDSNSVSVHIRRGDYILSSKTNKYHGLCSLEYYLKAFDLMREKVGDVTYFIFTDDTIWAKSQIQPLLKNSLVIEGNTGKKSYIDMQLMSECKHNIIANSSFSWWGAWLNKNPLKVVIAPTKWFASNTDSSNIIPSSWIKL